MKTITAFQALKIIKETQGKVFTAVFTKKDGTQRKMNCRLGVQKNLTGKGMAYKPADYDLMTVFDMKINDYRTLNLQTLTALQVAKEFYVIVGGA